MWSLRAGEVHEAGTIIHWRGHHEEDNRNGRCTECVRGAHVDIAWGGCSNEGIFEPAEQSVRHVYSAQFIEDLALVDIDADVIIAVPAARELQVIDDPWIGGLVLSLLPGEARERFYTWALCISMMFGQPARS